MLSPARDRTLAQSGVMLTMEVSCRAKRPSEAVTCGDTRWRSKSHAHIARSVLSCRTMWLAERFFVVIATGNSVYLPPLLRKCSIYLTNQLSRSNPFRPPHNHQVEHLKGLVTNTERRLFWRELASPFYWGISLVVNT